MDASSNGLVAVLSQLGDDGAEYVVAYGSHSFTGVAVYCVTRQELLAVVEFFGP